MIEVSVQSNKVELKGHADRMESDGIDRACAAVSALTCNLANSLEELAGEKIDARLESGSSEIRWDKLSEKGQLLVDAWYLGMVEINRAYNCINFVN